MHRKQLAVIFILAGGYFLYDGIKRKDSMTGMRVRGITTGIVAILLGCCILFNIIED